MAALGADVVAVLPLRFASVERWMRAPAPTIGQHKRETLAELLGLTDHEIDALEKDGVVGSRPTAPPRDRVRSWLATSISASSPSPISPSTSA